jgi:hypothetical protein
MRPYVSLPANRVILFPYVRDGDTVKLIEQSDLKNEYPKAWSYLKENEKYLRKREDEAMDHSGWYGFGRTQALDVMSLPKLITPDLAPRSSFLIDATGELFILGGAAGGYGLLPKSQYNPYYLLGILNSRAINFFITMSGQQMESGYYSFEARFIRSAPICRIDFSDSADKARYDRMACLAEQMVQAREQAKVAKTHKDQTYYESKCDSLDRQIDALAYELYGLTAPEIKLVEGTFKT